MCGRAPLGRAFFERKTVERLEWSPVNNRLAQKPTIPSADHHNFYKLKKWTKHGTKADRML
jgi:hypothetical protein